MKRTGGTLLTDPHISAVAAAGGVMVAGGAELHVLDRGAKHPRDRAFPAGEWIEAVAVAPGGTHHAAATEPYLHVYDEEGRSRHFLIPDEEDVWQSVAWGFYGGSMALYATTGAGDVYTIDFEEGWLEQFEHDPTLAVRADAVGRVALLDADDDGACGCWLFDERGHEAPYIPFPDELLVLADLAVGGDALAVAGVDRIWLRRSADAELTTLEGVLPKHAQVVHLAFAGARPDAPLLVGYLQGTQAHIVRVDARAEVTPLADMSSAGGERPLLAGMAWDDSHDTLWVAWHGVGVTFSRPARAQDTATRN